MGIFSACLRPNKAGAILVELPVKNLCWNLEIVSTIMEVMVDEGVINYSVELTEKITYSYDQILLAIIMVIADN